MPESSLRIWILKWSIRSTCNNSSNGGRRCLFSFQHEYYGSLDFSFSCLSQTGCGECHPSQRSFHGPDLYQSRFTFKVELLCTDIKLTWWMIGQTKPELQSSIIRLQVTIANVCIFTFNDTNVDVYHPATLILQTISLDCFTVLYITDQQGASLRSLIKYSFCELYLKATLSCT